ncbi:acyltransferase family protein [Agromyces sp. SYSU T00194]|uniref:acyltransferase family protein n=1 Tax=Agromyces chitinivorans TaxID=3158560 RepID=UPI0033976667
MSPPAPRVYLHRLTSLRFFAALVVVLNHVTRDVAPIPVLSPLATMGTAGVGFFFALSGFILTWSHTPGDPISRFYRKRFARVYPLHFATFLVSIPVLLVAGVGFTTVEVVSNVLLVQSWVPDPDIYFGMNAPSWSLACELLFYLLFPFAIPLVRRLGARGARALLIALVVAGIVVSIAVTVAVGGGEPARFLLYVFPPFRFLGFLAGVVLAHWMSTGRRFDQPIWLAATVVAVAYVAVFGAQRWLGVAFGHGVEDALLLPCILLLIATAASADLSGKAGLLVSRPLRLLGEWSFALYLTHWLLAVLVHAAFPGLQTADLPVRVAVDSLFIVVAIAVSALAYYTLEKPVERRLRGAPPRPAMAAA